MAQWIKNPTAEAQVAAEVWVRSAPGSVKGSGVAPAAA